MECWCILPLWKNQLKSCLESTKKLFKWVFLSGGKFTPVVTSRECCQFVELWLMTVLILLMQAVLC